MIEKLGRSEIVAELGQGAMGTVYKARDPLLDRTVAIKTISLNLPDDEVAEYEARFYQEAKAAGQLSHPNIVTIYDIGKSDQLAYMAMEFLEGQELRRILGSPSPIAIEKALADEPIDCDVVPSIVTWYPSGSTFPPVEVTRST